MAPVVGQVATFAVASVEASGHSAAAFQAAEDIAMPIAVEVSSASVASVAAPLDNSKAQSE